MMRQVAAALVFGLVVAIGFWLFGVALPWWREAGLIFVVLTGNWMADTVSGQG